MTCLWQKSENCWFPLVAVATFVGIHFLWCHPAVAEDSLRQKAGEALRRAVGHFVNEVATEGGYLWRYAEDFSYREGEGPATATQIWVQPPGTPSVGMAYLTAYEATGDEFYLKAARQAAEALMQGQLRSGGWNYSITFDPAARKLFAYRVDSNNESARNATTLDDDNTQAAIRLLMRVDAALGFKDEAVHEAAEYALSSVLSAQYPNGAWPQWYREPPDAEKYPVLKASYPESWSRTYQRESYTAHYTFNDNAMGDVIEVLLEAAEVYDQPKYKAAAEKCGEFILLAQMPEPQPAWAQQYDSRMHPVWARKFEPPSVTCGESQSVLRTLLLLYRHTGNARYLEPVPRAVEYLRSCQLPDGQLPRFMELHTNRPLYFTKDYVLTYSDADMPTHYAFKTSSRLDRIQSEYEKLKAIDPDTLNSKPSPRRPSRPSASMIKQTEQVIAALDQRGRWLEPARFSDHQAGDGQRMLSSQTFIENVDVLAQYLAATRGDD